MEANTVKDLIAIAIVVFIAIKLWKFFNLTYFVKYGRAYKGNRQE